MEFDVTQVGSLGGLVALVAAVVAAFFGGVAWGRKYPDKVEKLNQKIKELESKLEK